MSRVTNVIVSFSVGEEGDARIAQINEFFGDDAPSGFQVELDEFDSACQTKLGEGFVGGTKALETSLVVGAFNHLQEQAFVAHVLTNVRWVDPDEVQVFIKGQEDDRFTVYAIGSPPSGG